MLNIVDAPPAGDALPPLPPRRFDALDCVPRCGDNRPDAFAFTLAPLVSAARRAFLLLLLLLVPFGGAPPPSGGGADDGGATTSGDLIPTRAWGSFRLIAHHPSSSLAIWTTA